MIFIRTYDTTTKKESWSQNPELAGMVCVLTAPTANFNVNTATWITVPYQTKTVDSDYYTLSGGIVTPLLPGWYKVTIHAQDKSPFGSFQMQQRVAATTRNHEICNSYPEQSAGGSTLIYCDGTDDTIAHQIYQATGSTVQYCQAGYNHWFWMNIHFVAHESAGAV